MAEIKIPLRPNNDKDFKLEKREKDCLSYTVLTGCRNSAAFGLFFPEYTSADGIKESEIFKLTEVGKMRCEQFFANSDNKNYIASYRATLKSFLGNRSASPVINTQEIGEERKENALKSLLNQTISLVESGMALDADTLKTIADVFRKLGILKDEVEKQELPRRYLPVRCISECAYRLFVESHVNNGDIISECDYCKTRKFAEENGWHFDYTKNLELPVKDESDDPI